jgi:transcription initiation factor IIF auxiliary subunit
MSNLIITKQIIYGSVALWLGKKADDKATHKWSVYVRGVKNEDISYFIKEVDFTLHASFENNVRKVNKWPFELYEAGWGEFDIKITIYFVDESIKPMEFIHLLKLYPTQSHMSQSTKKPIVSETSDEIIFVNPNPKLKEILDNEPAPGGEILGQYQMPIDDEVVSEKSEKKETVSLNQGKENLNMTQSLTGTFQNKFELLQAGGNMAQESEDVEMSALDNAMQLDEFDGVIKYLYRKTERTRTLSLIYRSTLLQLMMNHILKS